MHATIRALFFVASAHALNVAVTGATGRTGRLVVDSLLAAGHEVTALSRDEAKAKETLPAAVDIKLLDLATATRGEMRTACADCTKLIWCATGFTEAGESLDVRGMGDLLPALDGVWRGKKDGAPSVLMLSSAGVSRPDWDDAKKERLIGASDIPIIRLNPGGILGKKCEAEELLRKSGLPYAVVRPTGLKFEDWPRGRPILTQGDVAVGRTNPYDLADHLVELLEQPAASGKTHEYFTLAGYPKPRDLSPALERLQLDADGPIDEAAVTATYAALQQCLPGEEQDATKLEMGRTYEQLDKGSVVPRQRGAAPTEREKALADGVAGGKRAGVRRFFRRLVGA